MMKHKLIRHRTRLPNHILSHTSEHIDSFTFKHFSPFAINLCNRRFELLEFF